jgi:phosphatidylglycerophosphatase A
MRRSPGERLARVVATCFGCGLFPIAPGTIGSLAAILIALMLHIRFGWSSQNIGLLSAAFFLPSVWAAHVEARCCGRKDPRQVVADELVGQWLTIGGATVLNWKAWLGAFLLFRLFDITKPAPARRLESLPGGLGIVADDAMAGIYAALVLYAAGWLNLY